MKKSFNIQNDLLKTYKGLMNLLPDELKNDPLTQKTILVYLKLGGEKLARHSIEVIKMRLSKEALENNTEAQDLNDGDDTTEPQPPELGGFEFPSE
jgi:hypothetical protein